MFHAARRVIPPTAFDVASAYVKQSLISEIPPIRRLREVQRRYCLCKALNRLTSPAWIIDCWRIRVINDSADVAAWEIATKYSLEPAVQALVSNFLCAEMVVQCKANMCR